MPRGLILLGVLGVGALLAMQPPINAQLARHVNALGAAFLSLLGSTLVVGALLLASGGVSALTKVGSVNPLYLTGGLIGAANVTVALLAVPRLGAGGVVAATVATQLVVSALLDRWGVLGLSEAGLTPARLLGF
ncbi:MAG TPA: DMT family transporter, partial [Capillimicrobium sp.]